MRKFQIVLFTVYCLLLTRIKAENNQAIQNNLLHGNGIQFIENRGQIVDMNNQLRPDILFVGDGGGSKVYLRKTGYSIVMSEMPPSEKKGEENSEVKVESLKSKVLPEESFPEKSTIGQIQDETENYRMAHIPRLTYTLKGYRIDIDFEGGNSNPDIISSDEAEGYFNYYLGHCPDGITNVKSYNRVVYKNIYPNIDIIFYGGKEKGLKYDIIVRPGGNPNDVKLKYAGADKLEVISNKLEVETSIGTIDEYMPKVYQNIAGKIIDVKAAYILDGTTLSFNLETRNSKHPIVIDPWITYYGGSERDESAGIAGDGAGNCFALGNTFSINFPVSVGAFQINYAGSSSNPSIVPLGDAFVVKFSPSGNRIWATYFGGSDGDHSFDVTSDTIGNIVITGFTYSPDFPFTPGAFQTALSTGGTFSSDAFLIKFSTNGARLWATYYGGSNGEYSDGVTVDRTGNIIFTGYTESSDFPVTAGAFQGSLKGFYDAFLVKFSPNGARLWATYYGGSNNDFSLKVSSDVAGNIVFVGTTYSTNFPVSAGAFQAASKSPRDVFLVKFNPNGTRLWATYYGGTDHDVSYGLAVDATGNIVFTGYTWSNDFPVTTGCTQAVFGGGGTDIFVVKFRPNGKRLWATYQGGNLDEMFPSCSIDNKNNIYVMGEWEDYANPDMPVYPCAFQKKYGGIEDQYITKYDSLGKILCNTYLGGTGEDELDYGGGIACSGAFLYVVVTTSGGYPATSGAFQTVHSSGFFTTLYNKGEAGDIAIASFCGSNCGGDSLNPDFLSDKIEICQGAPVHFSGTSNACDTADISYEWTFTGATPSVFTGKNPADILYKNQGTYDVKLIVSTPCSKDSITKNNYITITSSPVSVDAGEDTTISLGSSVSLNSTTTGTTNTWNPSNGLSCSTCLNPVASPEQTTTYYLLVADADGCTAIDSVTVEVNTEFKFFAPNTFTPNNDGINDVFLPQGINIFKETELIIFDRWGQLIYSTNNIGKGWDGKVNGRLAQIDVYVWKVATHDPKGDKHLYLGHVNLIR